MKIFAQFLKNTTLIVLIWFSATAQAQPMQGCSSVSQKACEVAKSLGKGINLGNMLDAPKEGDWGVKVEPEYFDLIAEKFTTVRIPIRWSNHASSSQLAIIDESFFQRVEMIVDKFLARGMYVIIDMHHYNQLMGAQLHNGEVKIEENVLEARFLNMWLQISQRFAHKSDKLFYELLNEPHNKLQGEKWHSLMNQGIAVIRKNEPNRILLVGPDYYNNISALAKFQPPKDKNIVISIHDYTPFTFTHQNISWLFTKDMRDVKCCSYSQQKEMETIFKVAADWSVLNGYPLYLGEFGSYEKGDMVSRVAYTKKVVQLATQYQINWAFWEFSSSFGVFDPKTNSWRDPLLRSLME